MNYQEQCTKYFAPLDEIAEALRNNEGICGISHVELKRLVAHKPELRNDLIEYENFSFNSRKW